MAGSYKYRRRSYRFGIEKICPVCHPDRYDRVIIRLRSRFWKAHTGCVCRNRLRTVCIFSTRCFSQYELAISISSKPFVHTLYSSLDAYYPHKLDTHADVYYQFSMQWLQPICARIYTSNEPFSQNAEKLQLGPDSPVNSNHSPTHP